MRCFPSFLSVVAFTLVACGSSGDGDNASTGSTTAGTASVDTTSPGSADTSPGSASTDASTTDPGDSTGSTGGPGSTGPTDPSSSSDEPSTTDDTSTTDTTKLDVGSMCGDGDVGAGEECEAKDLQDADCQSLGFIGGGTLACDPKACTFDTSMCFATTCGNGQVDDGEQCDGDNVLGFDCTAVGYSGGTLRCDDVTCEFDTDLCFF